MNDAVDNWIKGINETTGTINKATGTVRGFTNAVGTADRTATQAQKIWGIPQYGSRAQPSSPGSSQPVPPTETGVLDSPRTTIDGKEYFTRVAPEGTRLIIPAIVSSTGKERYLGMGALESIMNLAERKKGSDGIIVLGPDGRPSTKYYQPGQDGSIYLKGTNIRINVSGDQNIVRLSEAEFEAAAQALKTKTDKLTYFKTASEVGKAEDSTNGSGSWLSKNWWKILLGLVTAAGIAWGGIAIYNKHKEKEEKKEAQQTANTQSNENTSTNVQTNTATSASIGTNITAEQNNTITTSLTQGKENS